MFEQMLIACLVLVIFVVLIVFILKSRQYQRIYQEKLDRQEVAYSEKVAGLDEAHKEEIAGLDEAYNKEIAGLDEAYKEEITKLKKEYKNNFSDNIHFFEKRLIESFLELFKDEKLKNTTIYHQLLLYEVDSFSKIDFFLISPKGLFVIESKMWKGSTHVYYNEKCPTMFKGSEFEDFGVGSNRNVRIFNMRKCDDNSNEIRLRSYRNPVAQVREYSKKLKEVLGVDRINNLVVFYTSGNYQVLYNNEAVGDEIEIDEFTRIVKYDKLKEYFLGLPDSENNMQQIIEHIRTNKEKNMIQYNLKLDNDNYREAPFCLF
jgi:hypothetical protein